MRQRERISHSDAAAKSARPRANASRTTTDHVADILRDEIRRGLIKPGSVLRQEELAQRFEVSRIPVRDALLRLDAEGLLAMIPNRGAYVAALRASQIEEIYDLRLLLEVDLLRRAVPLMVACDFDSIELACLAAEQAAHRADWHDRDAAFHAALYTPAARDRQLRMVQDLRNTVDRYWSAYSVLPADTAAWLKDHRALALACRQRNVQRAADVLRTHIASARTKVLSAVNLRH